ncbi:hypothetical protein EVAR_95864_1 [Eumeta japonica]|uniref:Zinc finger protein 512B n=1 Tax=Eumeta variegata TaxID=151549 RepID=A0A4C1VLW1_EUMVA|nr:hypothetical protein EVAR_95864_1 [Eumeta japonica]
MPLFIAASKKIILDYLRSGRLLLSYDRMQIVLEQKAMFIKYSMKMSWSDRYSISTREAGNTFVTRLRLRESMGGDDHLLSDGSNDRLLLDNTIKINAELLAATVLAAPAPQNLENPENGVNGFADMHMAASGYQAEMDIANGHMGWAGMAANFGDQSGQASESFGHGDYGSDYGSSSLLSHDDQGHGFGGFEHKVQAYPVHQHVEEENPEPIKHYKETIVPLPKNVEIKVPHPVIIPVPHPVPIQVPVPKAVVIPIVKEVSIPVEKSVPYPVEKTVHVPKIKEVPFEVVKHILVPVEKPIPFKVPVYETIIHTKKGSHKI